MSIVINFTYCDTGRRHQRLCRRIGRYWIEQLAGIAVTVENASEYRYRHPAIQRDGVAIAISQSGESLDTLMALRYAADRG